MDYRLKNIQTFLFQKNLDAMIISSVNNLFYLSNFSNFSKEEREAYLLITKNKYYIFTDGRYKEAVEKEIKKFQLQIITSENSVIQLLKDIYKQEKITTVGFEPNNITFSEYKKLNEITTALVPIDLSIRAKKDLLEIQKIKQACAIGDKAWQYALQKITTDSTEKEIATDIELFLKQNQADIAFRPIVCFGANASMPHHEAGKRKIKKGDCVLIDMGAKIDEYCSDMTRTVFWGKPTEEQKKIYTTVLASQQKAIDYLNKKIARGEEIKASAVDRVAREYILSKGYPTIPHSLGHGIGIAVHESPSLSTKSDDILTSGMVFSIEPGMYLPDFMGVRIEDIVAIEKTELRILTLSSKEIIVL